jgi:hypothetical protein
MYSGRRVFKHGPGWHVMYVALTALFAVGTYALYRGNGWSWSSTGMALMTVFLGGGSIVESFLLQIELTDDAMLVRDLRGRKRYPIGDIERIEEAKGVSPSLRLKNGTWVKLPSVGSDIGNSVRAWLKAQ